MNRFAIVVALTLVPVEVSRAQVPLLTVPPKRVVIRIPERTVVTVARDSVTVSRGDLTLRLPADSALTRQVLGDAVARLAATRTAAATTETTDPTGTWMNATVAYNLASSGNSADKLNVAGQVILNYWRPNALAIHGASLQVPIIGNIAKPTTGKETAEQLKDKAQELVASSEGLYVGVAPYWQWLHKNKYGSKAFWSASFRTNALKDISTDSTFYLNQGRFSIGFQEQLGQFDTGVGSFSVETTLLTFSASNYARAYGERRAQLYTTDVVLIVPVGDNVGIVGQAALNHSGGDHVWRVGVLLTPAKPAAAPSP